MSRDGDQAVGVCEFRIGRLIESLAEGGVESFEDEAAFAAAADSGDDDKLSEGDADIELIEVVSSGSFEVNGSGVVGLCLGSRLGFGESSGEEGCCQRIVAVEQRVGGALKDELSAVLPGSRPDVDDLVGGGDHRRIVFDDHHTVASFDQLFDHAQQPSDVFGVQSGGRFVEDVEGVDEV